MTEQKYLTKVCSTIKHISITTKKNNIKKGKIKKKKHFDPCEAGAGLYGYLIYHTRKKWHTSVSPTLTKTHAFSVTQQRFSNFKYQFNIPTYYVHTNEMWRLYLYLYFSYCCYTSSMHKKGSWCRFSVKQKIIIDVRPSICHKWVSSLVTA